MKNYFKTNNESNNNNNLNTIINLSFLVTSFLNEYPVFIPFSYNKRKLFFYQ